MKYQSKAELRKTITNFLRQRKRVYKMLDAPQLCAVCVNIQMRFEMIGRWNYWRHCLEIKDAEHMLLMILPSERGGHATEREHMLQLIAHCKQVASIPAYQYHKKFSQDGAPLNPGELSRARRGTEGSLITNNQSTKP